MTELIYYEVRLKETGEAFSFVPTWFYIKIEEDGRLSVKINLTTMFGEGNEPHSVELFKRNFPTKYKSYTED